MCDVRDAKCVWRRRRKGGHNGMGWGLLVVACVVWCQLDAWLLVWPLVVYLERRRTLGDAGRESEGGEKKGG